MPRPLKFSQRLDRYPPILVRLLAVVGRDRKAWALTDRQIIERSGLSLADVKRISYSTSWADITIGQMQAFMRGCHFEIENRIAIERYNFMRLEGRFAHLRRSDLWEPYFRELVEIWADSVK